MRVVRSPFGTMNNRYQRKPVIREKFEKFEKKAKVSIRIRGMRLFRAFRDIGGFLIGLVLTLTNASPSLLLFSSLPLFFSPLSFFLLPSFHADSNLIWSR